MYWDYCYYSLAAAALQLTACSGYRIGRNVASGKHVLTFGIFAPCFCCLLAMKITPLK